MTAPDVLGPYGRVWPVLIALADLRRAASCSSVARSRGSRSACDEPRRAFAVEAVGVSKAFRLPHQQRTTIKEYFLHPFARVEYEHQQALSDVSFSDRARRVLRNHRPERKRQEHAAEDPRGHLQAGLGYRSRQRPSLAVHRARRRLQPRAERARQRPDQRHAPRPDSERDRRPVRRDHRVRGARAVRRPAAEELLVGDDAQACVLDRDPGRLRHPPARRGARGRRPGVPGELLRDVRTISRGEARRSSSSATTSTRSARYCERTLLLVDGAIRGIGPTHEILDLYQSAQVHVAPVAS